MRLPISDQKQLKPYLAPFSHSDIRIDRRQPVPYAYSCGASIKASSLLKTGELFNYLPMTYNLCSTTVPYI